MFGSTILRETKIAEQRRETKQEKVSEAAYEIFDTLYVPADAVVLDEIEADDLLAYGPDCVGTVIQIAYGVDRPFNQVITDYHSALLEDGWTLHPGYATNPYEEFVVYKKTEQVELDVDRIGEDEITIVPTPTLATRGQFLTIYTITITYTEPSNKECIG
jgi:hypothetical protein